MQGTTREQLAQAMAAGAELARVSGEEADWQRDFHTGIRPNRSWQVGLLVKLGLWQNVETGLASCGTIGEAGCCN